MKELINQTRKTIAFLGKPKGDDLTFYATGFFVNVEDILHLVTAKHVIYDSKTQKLTDEEMQVVVTAKEGSGVGGVRHSIKLSKEKFETEWIFHQNENVDIAIIPSGIDKEKSIYKTIPVNFFVEPNKLLETYGVFFLSYQPGIPISKVTPIVRSGTISLINENNTIYIDAATFPGNSGSPVFLTPSPVSYTGENLSLGGQGLGGKFIGVVGSYLPYEEVAVSIQTGKPRVIFQENTGLSLVWSAIFINEIIKSTKFRTQLERLKHEYPS